MNLSWGRMGSGVPSGLQNQHGELAASQVGSIPTLSRQKQKEAVPGSSSGFLGQPLFISAIRNG